MADSEITHDDAAANLGRTPRRAESRVPDWAPWAVLVALVVLGVVGGAGFLPMPAGKPGVAAARPETAAPAVQPSEAPPPSVSAAGTASDERAISVLQVMVMHGATPLAQTKKITRTREEARRLAEEVRARAVKGEDFAGLVTGYSDDPMAAKHGGFLKFRKKDAVKPFGDVAFALKVGEVSAVTETQFGFHVIRRTE
jgi:hypothetical protein